MSEIPAEAVRAVADAMEAEDNVRTFFSFSAMAKVALAALAEQGYTIVHTATPHPPLPAVSDKFSVQVMTAFSPYSPEYLADLLDLDAADLRDRYGDTVLYGLGDTGEPEFRRGGAEPSPAEVRETTAILRQATGSGTAPQPSGTLQGAFPARGGMSGRSDDTSPAETLSGLREELRRTVLRRNAANAMRGVHEHRAARLKTELDHAKAALAGDNEAIRLFMTDCTKTAERLREQVNLWQKAAEQAEAKLDRLREPHARGPRTNTCNDCGQDWPCETIQTIDEEKPHA